MNFNLKTPCKDCPFRIDKTPFLRVARVREIINAITRSGGTFACHKTVRFDEDGDHAPRPQEEHCAGAAIMLERMERPNQMMRIAERLGMYDVTALDMDAPVYASPDAMIAAYRKAEQS